METLGVSRSLEIDDRYRLIVNCRYQSNGRVLIHTQLGPDYLSHHSISVETLAENGGYLGARPSVRLRYDAYVRQ
jgi:hypothetical protein